MPGVAWSFSSRADGDFHIDAEPTALARRRDALMAGAWTWLRQVHGSEVVVVGEPGEGAGAAADAAVTDQPGVVLAVHTADCLPALLWSDGVIGAAHVGWRGLLAGVLSNTVDAMVALGAGDIRVQLGPHIRPRCYEFGADDLDDVAARFGAGVRAVTGWGTTALDLQSGVRSALAARPELIDVRAEPGCTACEPDRYFSHRARADTGRHAAVISLTP